MTVFFMVLNAKTPAVQRAFKLSEFMARRSERDRCPSDSADITAADTEIAQFAVAHPAEFGDGLTVLAPVVQGTCYVHNDPLS